MKRERLGSRLGFILLSAGCAIGIGNVWKFPYMVGQNGGGIFVLLYILSLVLFGVPIMTMEFALGRASQKSPVKMFQALQKPKQKWHLYGYVCMLGNYVLLMFYTTVSGWMLYYLYASMTGKYISMSNVEVEKLFESLLANPTTQIFCLAIIIIVGFVILGRGLQKGLEKITKIMMVSLLILMIVLAINSIFLKGGKEGLIFYLKPDLQQMQKVGLENVAIAALTQAFFTLSVGIGAMAIFGSYIDKKQALLGESMIVSVLDTVVAFSAGLIIFPACMAFGVDVNSGPKLLFITLPNVFNSLPLGQLWGSLFFLFMVFAAFSTVLAVSENIVSCCMDLFGWNRKKACIINTVIIFIISLPCALGFNVLSHIQPFGAGSNILDLEDFILSNILLPLGSMVFLIFCVSRYGMGWKKFMEEANTGKGLKVKNWMYYYAKYVLPIIVLLIFIVNLR